MKVRRGVFNANELVLVYGPPSLYRVEPGNKVMLSSGGPKMTVCDTTGTAPEGKATCQWIGDDGKLQTDTFYVRSLTCWGCGEWIDGSWRDRT